MNVTIAVLIKLPGGKLGVNCAQPIAPGDLVAIKTGACTAEKRRIKEVLRKLDNGTADCSLMDRDDHDSLLKEQGLPTTGRNRGRVQCICGTWHYPSDECPKCKD